MTFSAVFDTGLHADCVRFLPKSCEVDREIAVFSCYELDEKSGNRLGKLILAEKMKNDTVNVIQSVTDIPGVFEFSWFHTGDMNILVAASASGPLKFFKYEFETERLVEMGIQSEDFEMTLAVAGDAECLVTCDNKGMMRQFSLTGSALEMKCEWIAHDAEVWYVSQDKHNRNLFYSGSDDCSMKCWDIRTDSAVALGSNKTGHEAGVCCVVSSQWDEFIVASGSYDESVRIWDRRAFRAEPIKSIECGSGAWRVVWNPQKRNEIAVAAMRAGFHVIDLDDEGRIVRTESVDDHVAYGIDWHPNGTSLASCSFYNNQGQFF